MCDLLIRQKQTCCFVCPPLRPPFLALSLFSFFHFLTLPPSLPPCLLSATIATAHVFPLYISVFVYLSVFTSQQLDMVCTFKLGYATPLVAVKTHTHVRSGRGEETSVGTEENIRVSVNSHMLISFYMMLFVFYQCCTSGYPLEML